MWIESEHNEQQHQRHYVTPLAGVWIESGIKRQTNRLEKVTPLAGVWIERTLLRDFDLALICHSPCGSVD